jgi:hypothetical protein
LISIICPVIYVLENGDTTSPSYRKCSSSVGELQGVFGDVVDVFRVAQAEHVDEGGAGRVSGPRDQARVVVAAFPEPVLVGGWAVLEILPRPFRALPVELRAVTAREMGEMLVCAENTQISSLS